MKKLIRNLLLVLLMLPGLQNFLIAQVAEGIIYQAEARDNRGNLLINTPLDVKITIVKDHRNGEAVWEGFHQITSNNYGMFVLLIGSGRNRTGLQFESIEWGKFPHFLNVKVKKGNSQNWIDMGTEKFLSVPYAMHAKTATKIVSDDDENLKSATGVPSQTWSLFGNKKTNPEKDKLGTTDNADLVIVTNNEERLRITADGKLITADGVDMEIGGNLKVNGDSTYIDKDLYVGRDVFLNVKEGEEGETINFGAFTVENKSPSLLTGDLTVEGETSFKSRTVFDISVDGNQKEQESFPVLIKGSKQGLAIDLKQANPDALSQRGNNYISFYQNGVQKGRIEGMGIVDLDPAGLTDLICSLIANPPDVFDDITKVKGDIVNFNISSLFTFSTGEFPTLNTSTKDEWPYFSASLTGGALPALTFNFETQKIKNPFSDPCANNPLNVFLENMNGLKGGPGDPAYEAWQIFKDVIESANIYGESENAQSQLYSNYTLDFLTNLIAIEEGIIKFSLSFFGPHDPKDIFSEALSLYNSIISSVLYSTYTAVNLGVAYESGAGDYAEWLPRNNPDEVINPGDAVGVIGGKISKEFIHAEKFMAVSSAPIVLGNMPKQKKDERILEKVAFMGQVPVKVQGGVNIGDYILPSGEGNGIAIAVNPENMLARDYKRIIGVAWEESRPGELINLINTAVGINQNDMAGMVEEMQFTLNTIQQSLKKLDPEYQVSLYDVQTKKRKIGTLDYNVSNTHESNLTNFFEGKSYTNKKEMLTEVKNTMANDLGVNFEKAPLIKYLLENPEQAEKISV